MDRLVGQCSGVDESTEKADEYKTHAFPDILGRRFRKRLSFRRLLATSPVSRSLFSSKKADDCPKQESGSLGWAVFGGG